MENRIEVHPDICNGRPVVAGTRISVQTIMEFLGAGDSIEEILEEYPSLKPEDIYACIQSHVIHLRFGNIKRHEFHRFLARIWPQVETLVVSHKLLKCVFGSDRTV